MLFRNFTPFPPLQFESRDEKQNDFGVIVLRGTFQIIPNARLPLVQEQEPIVVADEYFGEPGKSSIRFESNIAPYKPKTDVLVNATAFPPSGKPEKQWQVAVQFGSIRKELQVTGPRKWTRSLVGWTLGEIEPTASVPIRYEYAYGGSFGEGDNLTIFDANPVGTGFVADGKKDPVQAPQLLPIDVDSLEFRKPVGVAGFGPIAPNWSPRREKAGTFNVVWEKTRWPDLPEDFTFDFYNTASSGLTLPGFADGTETVQLINMSRQGDIQFKLPHFELATLVRFEDGRVIPAPVNLDTIHIEMPENRVYLSWRGVFPVAVPLRVLEVRMKAPADVVYTTHDSTTAAQS
ncbi:MAG: DUF2169 domain-containing protein [Pirellulales bacterium]|nr:DUF2169 domain-containing protein [Pirellulales bacterium]